MILPSLAVTDSLTQWWGRNLAGSGQTLKSASFGRVSAIWLLIMPIYCLIQTPVFLSRLFDCFKGRIPCTTMMGSQVVVWVCGYDSEKGPTEAPNTLLFTFVVTQSCTQNDRLAVQTFQRAPVSNVSFCMGVVDSRAPESE